MHYKLTGEKSAPPHFKVMKNASYRLGAQKLDGEYAFAYATTSKTLSLLLYSAEKPEPDYNITLDCEYKDGDVFSFILKGINLDRYLYLYQDDDMLYTDPYAKCLKQLEDEQIIYGVVTKDKFDWKDDVTPGYSKSDLVMYKLHPRGFTKNRYSKVHNKGTFLGIAEKIPYLLELGINAVELMPVYEFDKRPEYVNYWGYDKGFYFVPKMSYSSSYGKRIDYTVDFKKMVRQFHENGIEVYIELFFPREVRSGLISDCIRYWKREYHIDGVHLLCDERARFLLAEDLYTKDLKLFYTNWYSDCDNENLYEYNDGFLDTARRLLKGDEDQLQSFLKAIMKNPSHAGNVNYITCNNGFTLMDLVSYDRKHNELNGERNKDGVDYNLSWNCGIEGPTKSRKINELRFRLMKNAMVMLLLSQGVPLIYAGDEFGNSQNGNNNVYCQDNETGWTDWNAYRHNRKYFEFVKMLIQFRKQHQILHMSKEPYLMDYRYFGIPDVSIHGSKAWYPELEHYNRHCGIMLCGKYADEEENIYIAYNLHWEKHELALPLIPGRHWEKVFDTDSSIIEDIEGDKLICVNPRTIVVLIDEKNS